MLFFHFFCCELPGCIIELAPVIRMKSLIKTVLFIACILFAAHASADMIIGGDVTHTVGKGENLYRVGAKYGVYWKTIARVNGLNEKDPLVEGTVLKLNTRKDSAPRDRQRHHREYPRQDPVFFPG